MIEFRVDFNSRGRGGLVRANRRRASGPVDVGEKVLILDQFEDDLRFVGTVEEIEPNGRIWLAIHRDVTPPTFNFALSFEPASGTVASNHFHVPSVMR